MSDPTIIVNLFQATLTGTTESIKKAEATLEQLQKDPNFLPNILLIPREQNISKNLKKAAALYTKKYVKNRLLQKDQPKINVTAELLLNQLSQNCIGLPLRRHIATSLQYLLMNDQRFIIRQTINPLCIKLLQAAKISDDSNVNFEFLGFFTQTLMNSFIHMTKEMNNFMQTSISIFCQLNFRIYKYVNEAVESQNKQKIIHIFQILKLYSSTLKIYLKKMMFAELQTVKILYDDNLYQLISASFNYTLKNNQINTNLIFYNPNADSTIIQLFHSIKADYVQSVGYLMKTIFLQFKDRQMISAHAILNNPSIIPTFVNSIKQLFNKTLYFKIKSPSLIKLVEQIINCQIIAVRNNFYNQKFAEFKQEVIHDCVMKVFTFSQIDCDTYYEDPDQFINQLLQIIERDSTQYVKGKEKQVFYSENTQQIQQYSNLRTIVSIFLQSYCSHIDGSLSQILQFSIAVLKNQTQSSVPKYMLLLMLCILRGQIIERQKQNCQIIKIICQILKSRLIPTNVKDPQNTPLNIYEANIQYLIILITAFRYLSTIPNVEQSQLQVIYEVVMSILMRQDVSVALQYQAFDLICSLCERQDKFEIKFIEVLNGLLRIQTSKKQRCLQTLCNLFSNPSQNLQKNPQIVVLTIQNLTKIVYIQTSKKQLINQLLVNKCWNVISGVCQDDKFIPILIPQIQQAIMPLLPFIDGKQNLDYQQDVFMMMSSFIQKSKSVTQNQLVMFQIIPKLFYTQYQYRFGHAFETLHIFILYGSNILASAPQAIKAIIQMAVCNMNTVKFKDTIRNQSQNCEGVIILQSLIMSCHSSFTNQILVEVAKALTHRLENPVVKGHILRSNIYASLALILMVGYKSFTNQDCQILLNQILQNHYCFVVQYSTKVAILAFSQLLSLYNLPFIANRFSYLLDTTINLVQTSSKKDIFNKNPFTEQQRDYDISLQTLKNMVTQMDQVDYFKKKIQAIKNSNNIFLQKAITELPEKKVQYLRNLINTTKVNNQLRPIFKLKK